MLRCPVCETANGDDAVDCAQCGRQLQAASQVPGFAPPVDGLERTLQDAVDARAERLPDLEPTAVASPRLRAPEERLEVERTPIQADPSAPQSWTAGSLELETGREVDAGDRTPAPADDGTCPWCGAQSAASLCDSCGRPRSKYLARTPPSGTAAREEHSVLCPACFSRVAAGARCDECGVPLPLREL